MNFNWSSREKKLAVLLAIASLLLISMLLYSAAKGPSHDFPGSAEEIFEIPSKPEGQAPGEEKKGAEQPAKIWIDLKGAVVKPGVYSMDSQSRLYEAVKEAGGMLPDAEQKAINMAMPLQDGQMVYIPYKGELTEPLSLSAPAGYPDDRVNLNTASKEELCTLPGIGEVKAQSIVEYREKNKGFKTAEELKEVQGIGEKSYEKLKDKIRLK